MGGEAYKFWPKGNKYAETYTEDQVEEIFAQALNYIIKEKKAKLINYVNIYLLKEHGVGKSTRLFWLNKRFIDNKRIVQLWEAMEEIIEMRVVEDKTLRPNVQTLVMQTKHRYSQKQDINNNMQFNKMPGIKVNGVEFKPVIGDGEKD